MVEKTTCILIIDCESGFAETARLALSGNFRIVCAATADDGFKKVLGETPDIVVLGYLEPRGASRQFAVKLAEEKKTAHIPLLVVDVRPEDYPRKGWRWGDGFSHNIKGYVWRPLDAPDLKKTVEGVLQRARSGSMNLTEVAQQTEEMLKRIDQLKKLLMSEPDNKPTG
ncbi:MAG: hypothetical protein Q8O43_03670 [Dehalococcoidia bacterium]|nr:hypothetical protein [Dehalococcoidia bacterium]